MAGCGGDDEAWLTVKSVAVGDLSRKQVTPRPKPVAKRRPKPRRTDLESSAAWHKNVLHKRDAALWAAEDYGLLVDGDKPLHLRPQPHLQAHHIIPRQQCRKHGVPEWDSRNGVPVTKRRHERHHSRVEPIHRSELPDEVYDFLAEFPVLWRYFDRMYPEDA